MIELFQGVTTFFSITFNDYLQPDTLHKSNHYISRTPPALTYNLFFNKLHMTGEIAGDKNIQHIA